MRTRAAVLYGVGEPLVVEEIELDPPKTGEVLVKMVATGICHSDIHVVTGDSIRDYPLVLGHEGAGIVAEVGPGVTSVKPGEKVILTFLPSCGKCKWCHTGKPNLCDLGQYLRTGYMLDGTTRIHRASDGLEIRNFLFNSTFAEHTVVPEASIVPVGEHVPLEKACLFGCGFTTGYGATTNKLHIKPGETVTIVGCGGLGLSGIMGAKASSAGMIIAIDVHQEKLDMAKKLGATHTLLNTHNTEDLIEKIQALTHGVGTDYSLEFVGFDQSNETLDIAYQAIRKGGTMCMVGVGANDKRTLPVDPYTLTLWRKSILGVLFGDAQFRADIPRYINLLELGKLDMDNLITHYITLDDINEGFQNVLAGNKVGRQIIRYT